MSLLNSQKAELHALLLAHRLQPSCFKMRGAFDRNGNSDGVGLDYEGSGYSFTIHVRKTDFLLSFSPGEQTVTDSGICQTWQNVTSRFSDWCRYLLRELNTPDPWENLAHVAHAVPFAAATNAPNTPFSFPELEGIWRALSHIQGQLLVEHAPTEQQREYVKGQIHFLVESSKTMGRKDWIILAIGALVGFVQSLALSPDQAQALFHNFGDAVRGIVHLIGG